jgi:bacteriocin-like protein
MSKSNDTSKLDHAPQVRELRDDELQNVSGGGNGTRVRFDRLDPAPFSIDIGTSENLVVNASSKSF